MRHHRWAAVAAAGIAALVTLRTARPAQGAGTTRPVVGFSLSAQARRYLTLQYGAYSTEFMGCMIGEQSGTTVVVRRIAPADVDPRQSTQTHVVPRGTCEAAGWSNTIGVIHSHPHGERCFYYFPGTRVASSDAQSFALQPYPVDAIMCGDSVVWIGRTVEQHSLRLVPRPGNAQPALKPGNRVLEGSSQ
jgi:proteasome lid subunit RPN8/RPN11